MLHHAHHRHYRPLRPVLGRLETLVRALLILSGCCFLLRQAYCQTLTFSPQSLVGKKAAKMQLWAVAGTAGASNRPPTAGVVYQLAAKHGVSYIDPAVAIHRLNAKDQKSLASRIFQWGTYFAVGAAEVINLKVISASPQVSTGLNIAMGITNALLPAVAKNIPVPDPAIAARIISGSLVMDAQGDLSGLFWAEPTKTTAFTESLP